MQSSHSKHARDLQHKASEAQLHYSYIKLRIYDQDHLKQTSSMLNQWQKYAGAKLTHARMMN